MAKNCVCCGKKLGLLAGENQLIPNSEEEMCDNCFSKVYKLHQQLKKAVQERNIEDMATLYAQIQKVIEESQFAPEGKDYIARYTDEVCGDDRPADDLATWKIHMEEENRRRAEEAEAARQKQSEAERNAKLRIQSFKQNQYPVWLTSGYNYEGYKIKTYLGVTSGSTVLGTGVFAEWSAGISDLLGEEAGEFSAKLEAAKDSAVYKLKYKAAKMGGNAIIGLDFDYITFSVNMIGVVANGTIVVIEKEE